jgi:hypothetical protein
MPVVAVASPKGGAGKSTASVILATELAHAGAEIVILDCDPNRSITIWASRAPLPQRISVRTDVGESEIVRTIKAQDADGRIVIVDLEGVASRLVSRAISQSPSEKEPSTIKELQVPRMADDVEVSSAFPVTMVDFTTTQLLARGLVSA